MSDWDSEFRNGQLAPYCDYSRGTTHVLGYQQAQLQRDIGAGRVNTGSVAGIGELIALAVLLYLAFAAWAGVSWLVSSIPSWAWWTMIGFLAFGALAPVFWQQYQSARDRRQAHKARMNLAQTRRANFHVVDGQSQHIDHGYLNEQISQLRCMAFDLDVRGERAAADAAYQEANDLVSRRALLGLAVKK